MRLLSCLRLGGLRGKNRVGEIVKLLEQNERDDVL